MKKISLASYMNKVRGCWLGKNIGGTLGAPLECYRGVFDVRTYMQDLSHGAPPNDDLDLQLLWLVAAEEHGRQLDARVLGEYWLSYTTADWSEYGAGKNNMRMGIAPPFSGAHANHNKDSNGAFIRSEIWACLMPGNPALAVQYAYEDAIIDHADEGVYAEVFCAAMESAAFAESDVETLIDIGLSYIPADCAVAQAVRAVRRCRQDQLDWQAARKKILQEFPSAFGMYNGYKDQPPEPDVPVGALGFDAPAAIGIILIGLLYGEGDFGQTICIAASCGEDADCTAATLGALWGIMAGADALPEAWSAPIGDAIKVGCVSLNHGLRIPQTVSELTNRTVRAMPVFMQERFDFLADGGTLSLLEGTALCDAPRRKGILATESFREFLQHKGKGIKVESPLFRVVVTVEGGIGLQEGIEKHITLFFDNKTTVPQWVTLTWQLPPEWQVSPSAQTTLYLNHPHGGSSLTQTGVTLTPRGLACGQVEALLVIRPNARVSRVYVPVTFVVG